MKIINNLYVRTHVGSMDACMHASIDDENLREKKWKGGEKSVFSFDLVIGIREIAD